MSLDKKRVLPLEGDCAEQKKCEKTLACSRPQRPAKRRRTDEPHDVPKIIESKVSAKVKRQVWTASAIDAFSEGLYQHGKNFHRILKYMQTKNKKKNDPVIPNLTKNQVRFFYYRTWHKVSALLMDPPNQPQATESKKPKSLKAPSTEEASPLAIEDGKCAEDDIGNPLDSSLEEQEVLEASPLPPAKVTIVGEDGEPMLGSPPPPVEPEVGDKVKELTGTSPGNADKCDGKKDPVKDTVVVNGVKHSLDMVALICYYKLKKKCPGEHNLSKRLSELVYHGTTTIPNRVKGKRKVQIKIPNCRALQGECKVETGGEPPLVDSLLDQNADRAICEPVPYNPTCGPQQITVELRPLSNASWLYVQGLAQNPRLRVTVSASKTISELLQFLVHRWQLESAGSEDAIHLYYTQENQSREHLVQSPLPGHPSLFGKDLENGSDIEVSHQSGDFTEPLSQSLSTCEGDKRESFPHVDEGKGNGPNVCADWNPMSGPSTSSTVPNLECVAQVAIVENQRSCNISQSDSGVIVDGSKSSRESHLGHSKMCEGPELVDDSSSDSCIQSRPPKRLNANPASSLSELHFKLARPEKLKLFYDIVGLKDSEDCSYQLKAILKLVEFVSDLEKKNGEASPSTAAFVHMSPKVREYIRSLPKKSPRKSPLTKYLKLKNRSPLRASVLFQPKRVRLDFESTLQTGTNNMESEAIFSESSPSHPVVITPSNTTVSEPHFPAKPPLEENSSLSRLSEVSRNVLNITNPSPSTTPTSSSVGSSRTVMTMLQVGQNTPEVVQLSKGSPLKEPRIPVVSVPKDSLNSRGSFSSIELPSVFSAVGERLKQTSSPSLHSLLTSETDISPKSKPGKHCELPPTSRPLWPPGKSISQKSDNVSEKTSTSSKATPAKSQAKVPDIMPLPTSTVECLLPKETLLVTSQAHCSRTQPGAAHLGSHSLPVSLPLVRQRPSQSVARTIPVPLDQGNCSIVTSIPYMQAPVSTIPPVSLSGLRLATGITSVTQLSQPVTHLSAANSTPPPVVTTLKPYSKTSRRPKKALNRPGQTRHLVPRPLLFLPQSGNIPVPSLGQQAQPSTPSSLPVISSTSSSSMAQVNFSLPITTSVGTSPPTINGKTVTTSTLQKQLLALTKALILQQRMQSIQAPPQGPVPEVNSNTAPKPSSGPKGNENKADNDRLFTSGHEPKSFSEREITEGDIQEVLLDNFLLEQSSAHGSSSSKLFHTSSDTVNELLKGLSTTQQDASIRKLTEETANVLPSFAKALTKAGRSEGETQIPHTGSSEGIPAPKEGVTSVATSSGVLMVENSKNVDRSSHLSFLNENNSLPDDAVFKQLSERCDIFDPVDFPDSMFAHLRDLTRTPEKHALSEGGHGESSVPEPQDSELSIGSLLDFLSSPEKEHTKHSSVESTYKSLMEENSVDYIQKFKEMASQMNNMN